MSSSHTSRSETYELLLHALSHEHSRGNFERHVLVLEKWCRESCDGLYIRDLNYVVEVLGITRDRLSSHPTMFTSVLSAILKNCALPLLECKANERMRPSGLESIKSLYAELSTFWLNDSVFVRTECARCFRVIVNGGKDPTVLRADQVAWKGDGQTAQVTDTTFIQAQLRESGALQCILTAFHKAVSEYLVEKSNFVKASKTASKRLLKSKMSHDKDEDSDDDDSFTTKSKDNFNSSNNNYNGESRASSPDSYLSPTENNPLSFQNQDDSLSNMKANQGVLIAYQELIYVLLDLCLKLSEDLINASQMCMMCICDIAMKLLKDAAADSARDPKISSCVELLWNCLESYLSHFAIIKQSSSTAVISQDIMDYELAIQSLRDVFLQLILAGYRLADKEVRNEVLVILTLIGNFSGAVPHFLQSGLFLDLVTYSCVGETGKDAWPFYSTPLAKFRNFFTAFDVDIQMKKEIWMLLSDLLRYDDPDMIMCVASSPLVSVLLYYLEQNPSTSDQSTASMTGNQTWNQKTLPLTTTSSITGTMKTLAVADSDEVGAGTLQVSAPAQLREIQTLAIIFLAENAHRLMGEFIRINGPERIIDIILKYGNNPNLEYKNIIFHSLLLLNRCLSNSNIVKTKLFDCKAIEVFLLQFNSSQDDHIRAQAARVISIMCADNVECQTQLRRLHGIRSLVKTLGAYADSRKPNLGNGFQYSAAAADPLPGAAEGGKANDDSDILVVAVMDCISNAVVGNRKNEARYAQVEGVDALLDVVEVAPLVTRVQSLRLLGDLLNNFRLVAFALAWKSGKTMRSTGQMLAQTWIEEEKRLRADRDNGVICNLWDPLGTHRWPEEDLPPPPVILGADLSHELTANSNGYGNIASSTSSTVTKLANAISSTRNNPPSGQPPENSNGVHSLMLQVDIRGILANILALLGLLDDFNDETPKKDRTIQLPEVEDDEEVDEGVGKELVLSDSDAIFGKEKKGIQRDESLTPRDLQVISIAARYGILREGQWWRMILEDLQNEGITPVEADAYLIARKLETFFEASRSVQFEQMELVEVAKKQKQVQENAFVGQIIQQKNQEIKSEWLKKKAQNAKVHTMTKVKLAS